MKRKSLFLFVAVLLLLSWSFAQQQHQPVATTVQAHDGPDVVNDLPRVSDAMAEQVQVTLENLSSIKAGSKGPLVRRDYPTIEQDAIGHLQSMQKINWPVGTTVKAQMYYGSMRDVAVESGDTGKMKLGYFTNQLVLAYFVPNADPCVVMAKCLNGVNLASIQLGETGGSRLAELEDLGSRLLLRTVSGWRYVDQQQALLLILPLEQPANRCRVVNNRVAVGYTPFGPTVDGTQVRIGWQMDLQEPPLRIWSNRLDFTGKGTVWRIIKPMTWDASTGYPE